MRRQHDIGEGVLFSSTGIDNISLALREGYALIKKAGLFSPIFLKNYAIFNND